LLKYKVASQDPGIRTSPKVESSLIPGSGHKIGEGSRFLSVRAAGTADIAVAGNNIGGPDTHIVKFWPLKGLVCRINQGNSIPFREGTFRADRIQWSLLQEIFAGRKDQHPA
jgi:hypothetical protein